MKDQKVTTTQEAQALIGVAVAGDPDLESALEILVTQATRKSQGRGSQCRPRGHQSPHIRAMNHSVHTSIEKTSPTDRIILHGQRVGNLSTSRILQGL